MMKLTTLTCCLAVAGAATLGAQSSETTTKTKIQVKDGKEVTVTGCVEAGSGAGYVLTHVADKSGALHRYILVSDDNDFAKHVGHRVQIEGKAADRDHGKVEITAETKMDGVDKDTHSKIKASGDDLSFMPHLGVKHAASHGGRRPVVSLRRMRARLHDARRRRVVAHVTRPVRGCALVNSANSAPGNTIASSCGFGLTHGRIPIPTEFSL